MNRIQFWILTGLSGLIAALLVAHIFLVRQANFEQARVSAAQQFLSQGQASQEILKQLAVLIFKESQKSQDPGLKELLTRQNISYTPTADSTNATDSAAPPPSSPSSTPPVAH